MTLTVDQFITMVKTLSDRKRKKTPDELGQLIKTDLDFIKSFLPIVLQLFL